MVVKRAVYTALLGGYERLNEQPIARESELEFICFTDEPDLQSDTWRIVPVEPIFPLDLVRSQRDLKIRGHKQLSDFDETLYIDNSVRLARTPESILDEWLSSADYGVSLHSYRERVIDEFDEVVALNYDDAGRVHEQLLHYSDLYPDVIQQHPFWNGMIARRRTDTVELAMRTWFDHVLRFSRRDQLSANVAMFIAGLSVNAVELDNFESELHPWPVEAGRKIHLGKNNQRNAGPILAEVARLKRSVADLSERAEKAESELLTIRGDDEARLQQAHAETERLVGDYQRQLNDLRSSASWRISAPVRWAGDLVRLVRRGASK